MEGGWNHRVMRRTYPKAADPTTYFEIHEVFYDANGKPDGWTVDPVAPQGESVEELAQELRMMLKATEQPVLDFDAPNSMLSDE